MTVEAPAANRNIAIQEEFVLEGFDNKLHIGKRFKRWAGDCLDQATSTLVNTAVYGPRVIIDTAKLMKWHDHASWITIAAMTGGMTYAFIKDSQQIRSVETVTPTPTPIVAEVRSSQGSISYTPSYIPPSLIATPTPRRPFGV